LATQSRQLKDQEKTHNYWKQKTNIGDPEKEEGEAVK